MSSSSPSSSSSSSSSSNPYAYVKGICNNVLQLDKSIRFAGIANKMGTLIGYKIREGLVPLLNEAELENNIMKTVLRMKTREDFESKLGEVIYTFALYKRVKRASIPLDSYHQDMAVLTVSFDMAADHDSIIMDKILPFLKQRELTE
ncbi:MAG: hypothetical protein M3270_07025 [Thermoproteota archaeon]|nr:hypothetical protein [Thermoproteota archaeon]